MTGVSMIKIEQIWKLRSYYILMQNGSIFENGENTASTATAKYHQFISTVAYFLWHF